MVVLEHLIILKQVGWSDFKIELACISIVPMDIQKIFGHNLYSISYISLDHVSIYLIRVFSQCIITARTTSVRSHSMTPIQTQLVLSFLFRIQFFRAFVVRWSNGENPHCNPRRDITKTFRKYLDIV